MTLIRPLYQNAPGKIGKALVTPTGKRGNSYWLHPRRRCRPKTMCSDYITTLLGVQPADLSELLKIVRHFEPS